MAGPLAYETRLEPHFNAVAIDVKLVTRFEPIVFSTAMIATDIPAAIKPYSMAVAPDSFWAKEAILAFTRIFRSRFA